LNIDRSFYWSNFHRVPSFALFDRFFASGDWDRHFFDVVFMSTPHVGWNLGFLISISNRVFSVLSFLSFCTLSLVIVLTDSYWLLTQNKWHPENMVYEERLRENLQRKSMDHSQHLMWMRDQMLDQKVSLHHGNPQRRRDEVLQL
jgi:hypothetical protein